MTFDQLILKYDEVCKDLADHPETVTENAWRGMLASFAFEMASAESDVDD